MLCAEVSIFNADGEMLRHIPEKECDMEELLIILDWFKTLPEDHYIHRVCDDTWYKGRYIQPLPGNPFLKQTN